MIRDFTKSAMSFSWAFSLLGIKQAVNMLRPGQQGSGDLLTPMTQMAVEQLDESMRGIYRSGDNLQVRAVDMAFSMMNPGNLMNPTQWMSNFTGCGRQAGASGNPGGNPADVNGFAQAAAGMGQAMNQATSGLTQAVSQAASGIGQAIGGMVRPGQPPASGPTAGSPGAAANDDSTAGWGPMP